MQHFVTEKIEESSSYGKFVISPLPEGFGHTLGNALRRTLLSEIAGAAVSYVKINDAVHPFSTVKGVKESVLDIILNLKTLRFKTAGEGPFELTLVTKGKGMITGADFKEGDVSVINKDQFIAEVTDDKTKLEITLIIEKGHGYVPSEDKEKKEFGMLAVDSIFSPVTKVNYLVEGTRVGRKTNFDKITLEMWTDGTIMPSDAIRNVSKLLSEYFAYILSGNDVKAEVEESVTAAEELGRKIDKKVYQTIIDELDLPTRVINALLREKIETIEDLLKKDREVLINLKGVGKKSLDLIEKELEKLGIPLELK
jgi:DNA-directed RNA polymerase subunit alpha